MLQFFNGTWEIPSELGREWSHYSHFPWKEDGRKKKEKKGMHKGLYVLVGKEPGYEERSWFQLLLYWMLNKKHWSTRWIYTRAPHLQASAGEKAVNESGLGDQPGRGMAAGAEDLWYPVTVVSHLPSAKWSSLPLPKMRHGWMVFLRHCHPAVFSLFEGVSSQWTRCTRPSFLLNFLLCVCVCVNE